MGRMQGGGLARKPHGRKSKLLICLKNINIINLHSVGRGGPRGGGAPRAGRTPLAGEGGSAVCQASSQLTCLLTQGTPHWRGGQLTGGDCLPAESRGGQRGVGGGKKIAVAFLRAKPTSPTESSKPSPTGFMDSSAKMDDDEVKKQQKAYRLMQQLGANAPPPRRRNVPSKPVLPSRWD
jgi:hypothetical protein